MVKQKKGLGAVKRFGPRYGRTVKHKLAKIEFEQRKKHKCPFCTYSKVSRESFGIWNCSKCDARFAAKAHTIGKRATEEFGLEELLEKSQDVLAQEGVTEEKQLVGKFLEMLAKKTRPCHLWKRKYAQSC